MIMISVSYQRFRLPSIQTAVYLRNLWWKCILARFFFINAIIFLYYTLFPMCTIKAEIEKYESMVQEEVSVDEAREKMLQINTRICIAILKDSVYNKNYRRS